MFSTWMLLDLQEILNFVVAVFVPDIGFLIVMYKFWPHFWFLVYNMQCDTNINIDENFLYNIQ